MHGLESLWAILRVSFQTKYGPLFLPAVERAIAVLKQLPIQAPVLSFELACILAESTSKLRLSQLNLTGITPWPSEEDWAKFLQTADEKATSSLQQAFGLLQKMQSPHAGAIKLSKLYTIMKSSKLFTISSNLQDLFANDPLIKHFVRVYANNEPDSTNLRKILVDAEQEITAKYAGEMGFSYLIDIASVAAEYLQYDIAERIISRYPFTGSADRTLVALQIELERIKGSEQQKGEIRKYLSLLQTLTVKARDVLCDVRLTHRCCVLSWKALNDLNLLHDATRPLCCDILKTVCETTERVPGIDKKMISSFEQELALCYENQNIFSLAIVHAEKALKYLDVNDGERANEIELFLNRLWIKGNTFDGNLKPDLKALSLADQAKYISEPNLIYKMLEKALKIIDHELVVTSGSYHLTALLQNTYRINFDSIDASSAKSRRLVQAALSDIMRQSRTPQKTVVQRKRALCFGKWCLIQVAISSPSSGIIPMNLLRFQNFKLKPSMPEPSL
ncbi:hypothetical protein BC829DRAFT_46648 [Chytridium lagenaria]|nr:hypothetical protein BC829DRAFT_46648 [Chytridium lagenaria]